MHMNEVKRQLLDALEQAAGGKPLPEDIKESPVADYGSPIAFKLARKLKGKPQDIAAEIAGKIRPGGYIAGASAESGYVNFNLNYSELTKHVLSEPRKPAEKHGKIILEHTSVNPSGPVHVGRIRNTIIGDSLRRILEYSGFDVETHYYVNDVGKQVAIIAAGLSDNMEPDPELKERYDKYAGREDYRIFFTYVQANRRYENNEHVVWDGFSSQKLNIINRLLTTEVGRAKMSDALTAVDQNPFTSAVHIPPHMKAVNS